MSRLFWFDKDKLLKRYLENYGLEKVDGLTAKQLFRTGYEQGLIREPTAWFGYLEKRNLTSHTYDGAVAERVYEGAKEFIGDAQYLLQKLKVDLVDWASVDHEFRAVIKGQCVAVQNGVKAP